MIKILHIADIHIGAPFKWLGEKGKEQRKQLKKTFSKIIEIAIAEKIDIVLVAGDLFDSNIQAQSEIDFVLSEFRRLEAEHIMVCIIGGTHDCLNANSILRKCNFTQNLSNVFLFDEKQLRKVFDGLDLAVFGCSLDTNKSNRNPLEVMREGVLSKFNIGMIHGSAMIEGKYSKDDWPFSLENIDNLNGFNYVACGHWHSYLQLPTKKVKAAYSGSPELIAIDQSGSGNIVMINILENGETKISPIQIGKKKYKSIKIDAEEAYTNNKLSEIISPLRDNDLVLEVTVKGLVNISKKKNISIDAIEDEFEDEFFKLIIKDASHIKVEEINLDDYQDNVTIGKFIRIMMEEIKRTANEERKEITEEALRYGIALLEGQEVI